jgi:hypothetical protein
VSLADQNVHLIFVGVPSVGNPAMKRYRTSRKVNRTGHIRQDLTAAQLAGIGAVAVAYNEAENLIDLLLRIALDRTRNIGVHLTARINGADGKIELAKIAMCDLKPPAEAIELLASSLGNAGFAEMKKYRDAIIHARVLDAPAGLALTPGKRGKTEEVLLTISALDGVYERLVMIRLELIKSCEIAGKLGIARAINRVADPMRKIAPHFAAIADLGESETEREIQALIVQHRAHQKSRLSLAPLPQFPEEPPVPSGMEGRGDRPESPESES